MQNYDCLGERKNETLFQAQRKMAPPPDVEEEEEPGCLET